MQVSYVFCFLKMLKSLEVKINFTPVLPPSFYVCNHKGKRKKKKRKKKETQLSLIQLIFSEMSVFFKDQL